MLRNGRDSGIDAMRELIDEIRTILVDTPQWIELTSATEAGMAVCAPITDRRLRPTGRTKILLNPKDWRRMVEAFKPDEPTFPPLVTVEEAERIARAQAAAGPRQAKGARLFGIRVYDVDEQTPELQAWLAEELAELGDQGITR